MEDEIDFALTQSMQMQIQRTRTYICIYTSIFKEGIDRRKCEKEVELYPVVTSLSSQLTHIVYFKLQIVHVPD